jgi:spartin
MSMHPAYRSSTLVSKAAMASRLIVTTSGYVSKTLQSHADNFTQKTKPNSKPMTFTPTTHARIRKVHTFTEGAAGLSSKTVGQVSKVAQNIGATLAKRGAKENAKGIGPDGQPIEGYKPGLLNKSMMAFSTIADGIDQAGRNLLASTSTAATTVVGHKYGSEAGEISKSIGGGFKNVGLVYIDAAGVSRKAVIKSVAKGMVIGKVRGGGDLVVGGGDGGSAITAATPPKSNWKEREAASEGRYAEGLSMSGAGVLANKSPTSTAKAKAKEAGRIEDGHSSSLVNDTDIIGFGRQAPPPYGSGVGEPIAGSKVTGDVKR